MDLAAAEREGEDDEEAEAANAQVTFSLKPRQSPTTDWEASETRILNPMRMVTRSESVQFRLAALIPLRRFRRSAAYAPHGIHPVSLIRRRRRLQRRLSSQPTLRRAPGTPTTVARTTPPPRPPAPLSPQGALQPNRDVIIQHDHNLK